MGTDLRRADLTGALLDENALDQSHWNGARGVSQEALSHAGLHNAGVQAAEDGPVLCRLNTCIVKTSMTKSFLAHPPGSIPVALVQGVLVQ